MTTTLKMPLISYQEVDLYNHSLVHDKSPPECGRDNPRPLALVNNLQTPCNTGADTGFRKAGGAGNC